MRQTCSCPFQNSLYPELHDPADQVVRNWFIEWKSYRSLSSFITGQLFFEFLTLPGRGIKPDMFFVGGKINQIPAFQIEGRYFIADRLFRARRRFPNSHPYLFQNLLNGWGSPQRTHLCLWSLFAWFSSHFSLFDANPSWK